MTLKYYLTKVGRRDDWDTRIKMFTLETYDRKKNTHSSSLHYFYLIKIYEIFYIMSIQYTLIVLGDIVG